MKIIFFIVGIITVITTILPLIPKDNWWIRGFDFPRLQVSTIIVATIGGYLFIPDSYETTDHILLVLLFLCLIYQSYMIYPYTRFAEYQIQPSKNPQKDLVFSLLCTNVQMDNRSSAKLKDIIRENDPDIILAIETDNWWLDQLKEFEEHYPYTVKQPQDNMYGMVLYSRLDLVDPEIKFLIEDDIPSIHLKTKLPGGQQVQLYCLHPRPPWPSGNDTSTERDAELLIVGKEIQDSTTPTIVFGDMNDVAWSKTNYIFQEISGLLDPRVGRGFFNSFHAKYPFIRFPLDHFFHSNHFRLIDFKRLDYIGSDHFPVYIKLSLEPDAKLSQDELKATASEEQEAQEKIEEGVYQL